MWNVAVVWLLLLHQQVINTLRYRTAFDVAIAKIALFRLWSPTFIISTIKLYPGVHGSAHCVSQPELVLLNTAGIAAYSRTAYCMAALLTQNSKSI